MKKRQQLPNLQASSPVPAVLENYPKSLSLGFPTQEEKGGGARREASVTTQRCLISTR